MSVQRPEGWSKAAVKLWHEGKQGEAIDAVFKALSETKDSDVRLVLQAAYYFYLLNDFHTGVIWLNHHRSTWPDHQILLTNLALFHSRLGQYDASLPIYKQILEQNPDNTSVLDGYTAALATLGHYDEAKTSGSRVLELKNALACQRHIPIDMPSLSTMKEKIKGLKNVVAFSLWGDGGAYCRGALHNLAIAGRIYPDWKLRFYVDSTVPQSVLVALQNNDAEVVMRDAEDTVREKLAWRFDVANDPTVGLFLVRDVDSVVSEREAIAVSEWIDSEQCFHVMRDWWTHTDLILAGMWGGVSGLLPNLSALLKSYQNPNIETSNVDQSFLKDEVWPRIRTNVCVHDRCFNAGGTRPFPGFKPTASFHVGQNEYVMNPDKQEEVINEVLQA